MLFLTIVSVAFAFSASTTTACQCREINKTIADSVCENHVVVRAVVQLQEQSDNITIPDGSQDARYPIRIIDVFKNAYNFSVPSFVRTPGHSGNCGGFFAQNELVEYLIFADVEGESSDLRTSLCRHNRRWSDLPTNAVESLKSGKYVGDCKNDSGN